MRNSPLRRLRHGRRRRESASPHLPNLIIPGAGKSGTSSLHEYLGSHPDIFMSEPKELHFFSSNELYHKGLKAYAAAFEASGDRMVRGESSTTYLHFPHVVERIQASLSEVRFIFILRNPIDRVDSHYRWLRGLGYEGRSFREAFQADQDDEPDFANDLGGAFLYYATESRYGLHVGRFIDAFGRSSILVITAEELRDARVDALAKCARFLGVAPFPPLPPVWVNATGETAGRLSDDDRAWLREIYAPDVALLRARLDQPFTEWADDFPPDRTSN